MKTPFLFPLRVLLVLFAASASFAAAPRVAFIFDDGPVSAQTAKFIDLLARENVRVSFAYVGKNVAEHPHLAHAAAAAGHELVNHSYTHPHFTDFDDHAIEREIRETQLAIEKATRKTPRWFWAPFGDWDRRIEAAVRAGGLEHLPAGNIRIVSTDDWNRNVSASEIRRRATDGIRDRTLIVCHEWREETLAELPAIFAELRQKGFEFVTVSELVAAGNE